MTLVVDNAESLCPETDEICAIRQKVDRGYSLNDEEKEAVRRAEYPRRQPSGQLMHLASLARDGSKGDCLRVIFVTHEHEAVKRLINSWEYTLTPRVLDVDGIDVSDEAALQFVLADVQGTATPSQLEFARELTRTRVRSRPCITPNIGKCLRRAPSAPFFDPHLVTCRHSRSVVGWLRHVQAAVVAAGTPNRRVAGLDSGKYGPLPTGNSVRCGQVRVDEG